jgi:hypothetical protein
MRRQKQDRSASVSQAFTPLGQEFEPFLFAIVCDEGNGMPLTTLSAIARSGVDPWKEAARIANLPKAAALDALARMIPEGSADGGAVASRLFALLPATRQKMSLPVVAPPNVGFPKVGFPNGAAYGNPIVIGIMVLIVCLALFFAFRKTDHSAGPSEPPSSAPAADKLDR